MAVSVIVCGEGEDVGHNVRSLCGGESRGLRGWMELRLIEEDESGDKEVNVTYCWGRGWKT